MNIVFDKFIENEENITSVNIGFKNSILKHAKEAFDFYSCTLYDVEIKTDCVNIDIGYDNAAFEGVWISHNGEDYILSVCFYISNEFMKPSNQKILTLKLTEKQFEYINNHFLMEERCLIG